MNLQQLKELAKLADSEVTWILLPKDLANEGWCTEVVNYISVVSPSTITALVDRIEAAERERDELLASKDWYEEAAKGLNSRLLKAEEEIARRDAEAGEGDDRVVDDGCDQQIGGVGVSDRLNCVWPIGTKFYTAAPPAVLPPECMQVPTSLQYDLSDAEKNAWISGANAMREHAKALGAQPQKPVVLPSVRTLLYEDGCPDVFDAKELKTVLDAANVKWEVKK